MKHIAEFAIIFFIITILELELSDMYFWIFLFFYIVITDKIKSVNKHKKEAEEALERYKNQKLINNYEGHENRK